MDTCISYDRALELENWIGISVYCSLRCSDSFCVSLTLPMVFPIMSDDSIENDDDDNDVMNNR